MSFDNSTGSPIFIDYLYGPDPYPATSIDFLRSVTIFNGTLESGTNSFTGFNIAGILNISSGTTLKTSGYVNSSTFSIAFTGTLNTSYLGAEGWWSGTNSPTFSIDNASTINYSASSAQNVYARQYGNLELSNTGTKTLNGSDPLDIRGNMNISSGTVIFDSQTNATNINGNLSNSGTWTPTQAIAFEGTGTQIITGGTTFSGGMVFGDGIASNTVELSSPLSTTNIEIKASSSFDPKNNNLAVSGFWKNDGTYTAGTESITFNGTTDISGATITTFNDIIISGILNVNTNTLNVSGSFTNNNTFNRGTGTIAFNGTGTQNVSGSSPISFHNLTISNLTAATDVVNINSNVDLYNILTLNGNGHIDADGSSDAGGLTLISGDNGTAKIGTIGSGAVFDGNVTTQRRIVPATVGWRHISTPVKNQTLASWTDDFSVQGVIGGTFPTSSPIVFNYDETLGTDTNNGVDGWQAFTNVTDNISNTGIRVYFFCKPTNAYLNSG